MICACSEAGIQKDAGFFDQYSMRFILFIFGFCLSPILWAQGGWVKEKGEGYFQTAFNTFSSDQYYNIGGELLETNVFSQQSVSLYGEYGLGGRFALVANFIGYRWNGFETTETVSGMGDLYLAAQYALLKGKFPVSITVGPEIPTGQGELFAQSKLVSFERINLPPGDGEWNVRAFLASSHKFEKLPLYASAHISWNFRTSYEDSELSDQFSAGVEIGYNPFKPLWLQAKLGLQESVGKPAGAIDFVRGEGTSFASVEFLAAYTFWKSLIALAGVRFYGDFIVDRANLYDGTNYTFGLAYKLAKR